MGKSSAIRRLQRTNLPVEWFFVELTNHCPLACPWCPSQEMTRSRGMMPVEQAKALVGEIAAYQQRHRRLRLYAEIKHQVFLHVMGEPLLHPALAEIVRHGQRVGLDFCLMTNATLLFDDFIRELVELGLANIVVGLNAPDGETYSKTGSPLTYEDLLDRIRGLIQERFRRGRCIPRIEIQLLNTRGIRVAGGPLVETVNQVDEQYAFWSWAVRRAEGRVSSRAILPHGRPTPNWQQILRCEANDPNSYVELGENVYLTVKRACTYANTRLGNSAEVRTTPHGRCPYRNPYRVLCILWDGSCTCCSLDADGEIALGNIFDAGIDGVWNGERIENIRRCMDKDVLTEAICQRCLGTIVRPARVGSGRNAYHEEERL